MARPNHTTARESHWRPLWHTCPPPPPLPNQHAHLAGSCKVLPQPILPRAPRRRPGAAADVGKDQAAAPAAPPPPPPAALRALAAAGRFAREQWFILGLGLAIGLAAAVPNLGRTGGWIRSEYSIKIPATVLIFIISGIGLKTKALLGAVADAWVHVRVQAISLALLPAIGYGIAKGLRQAGFNRCAVALLRCCAARRGARRRAPGVLQCARPHAPTSPSQHRRHQYALGRMRRVETRAAPTHSLQKTPLGGPFGARARSAARRARVAGARV